VGNPSESWEERLAEERHTSKRRGKGKKETEYLLPGVQTGGRSIIGPKNRKSGPNMKEREKKWPRKGGEITINNLGGGGG